MATGRKQVAAGQTIQSIPWGNPVWDQSVQNFASSADRLNQFPTPQKGAVWYLEDTRRWQCWDGQAVATLPAGISQRLTNAAVTYSTQSVWYPMQGLGPAAGFAANPLLPVNASGSGVQIVIPGRYVAQATANFTVATLPRGVGVRLNTGGTASQTTDSSSTTAAWLSSPAELFDCVAGDVIEGVTYQQNVGTNTWPAGILGFRCWRVG